MTDLGLNKHPDGSTTIKVAKWFVGDLSLARIKSQVCFPEKTTKRGLKMGQKKKKNFAIISL